MTHAIIIGAGIAGPVTAMALQRAGIESTVYEANPETASAAGVFLTVAVNGLNALRTLDVHELVTSAGFPSRRIELLSGTGKRLGEVALGGRLADGTETHSIKRSDLYQALYDESVRRGIRFEHGKRLMHAEHRRDGTVVARFADGTEEEGDLVIGADGIHSRTRSIIDPAAPAPRYTGLGNIGGFTRAITVCARPGHYVMIFGRRAFFGYTVSPSGEVWWFANPPSLRELTRDELAATTGTGWRQQLIELFADDAGPAAEIIWSTSGELIGFNQHDMPSVPTWHRGRMIVIGDAAHATAPSSGQGASMAIEDAVTLALCLRDWDGTESAFARYESLRRERVERVVAFGKRSGSYKVPGPLGRVVRDLVLPVFLRHAARPESQAWLYQHHIEWDTHTGREPKLRDASIAGSR